MDTLQEATEVLRKKKSYNLLWLFGYWKEEKNMLPLQENRACHLIVQTT